MNKLRTLVLTILITLSLPAWSLDAETLAAKNEGMRLYNIYHRSKAVPYLEQAAAAGDVESMYTLGEIDRLRHMGLTKIALDWYLKAAEHGEIYAMLRLRQGGACELGDYCPGDAESWPEAALAIVLPKAKQGDPEAMSELYDIYNFLDQPDEAIDWLEKSAKAGYPEAQDWLGSLTRDGLGFYFTDSGRLEAAEKWVRKAAEQGYVPAMNHLSDILIKQERFEESWEWEVKASEAGLRDSRLTLSSCYLEPERRQACQVERDIVKGWAILYAMQQEIGNSNGVDVSIQLRRHLVNDQQRLEAKALAEAEWIGHGPPLSNFPPKFGF